MRKSIILSVITASLFAGPDIHLGMSHSDVTYEKSSSDTTSQYLIGYGMTGYFDPGLLLGVSFDMTYKSTGLSEDLYGFDTSIRVGYHLDGHYGIYGVLIANMEDYGRRTTFYGMGLGAGVEMKLSNQYLISLEYRQVDMITDKHQYEDYGLKSIGIVLKYLF